MSDDFWGTKITTPDEAAYFALRAYAFMQERSGGKATDVHELLVGMTILANRENVHNAPIDSRRERATTALRKAGFITRSGTGWLVTEAGRAHLAKTGIPTLASNSPVEAVS